MYKTMCHDPNSPNIRSLPNIDSIVPFQHFGKITIYLHVFLLFRKQYVYLHGYRGNGIIAHWLISNRHQSRDQT